MLTTHARPHPPPHPSSDLWPALLAAQKRAEKLFAAIEETGIILPGRSESAMNKAIFALAKERFGIEKFWHKRIVRVGANTVLPYRANPPDIVMGEDDIAFVDLGPVFGNDEADFGRTYVVGTDPEKLRLASDLPKLFKQCRDYYLQHASMTGADLYAEVVAACAAAGWVHGHTHAGHIIGFFPHEKRIGDGTENYICADNHMPMDAPTATGERRHWILEIHAVHPLHVYGGFCEELLA